MFGRLIWIGLLVAVIAVVGLLLFRPAKLFGLDGDALANSVGSEVQHSEARCVKNLEGRWDCVLTGSSVTGAAYVVTTDSYGCWSGTRTHQSKTTDPVAASVSGCVGLTDLLGH